MLQQQVGIVGNVHYEEIIVADVYNKGTIIFNDNSTNSNTAIGGICGAYSNNGPSGTLNNSYLRNAYNIGNIKGTASATLYVGSIYGLTSSTTIIENCYYLQNSEYQGIGQNGSSNSEINEFTESDKENLLDKLNGTSNTWKHDTGNINNGYPILEWQ